MILSEKERSIVISALRVAAVNYVIDAKIPGQHERVAAQFHKQATEASALADKLEEQS